MQLKDDKYKPFIDFLFKSAQEHGLSVDASHEQLIFHTKYKKLDSEILKKFKITEDGLPNTQKLLEPIDSIKRGDKQ